MEKALTKLLVRNLPQFIYDLLLKMSERNDRSVEAEARHALKSWVGPLIQEKESTNRRLEISQRLQLLLDATNDAQYSQIKLSHIAEGLGMELAEPIERWFQGIEEPKFSDLKAIARLLNASSDWLRHGDGQMYEVNSIHLSEDAKTAVKWLLEDEDSGEAVTNLYLVRAKNECGDLTIVKQFGDRSLNCKTYNTGIHVSEVIGAGGETALVHFFVTLELLYKIYTKKSDRSVFVQSFLLPEDQYKKLTNGTVHPLSILSMRRNPAQPWWEDIWDKKMQLQNTYWDGWPSLVRRISFAIEHSGRAMETIKEIRECSYVSSDWLSSGS